MKDKSNLDSIAKKSQSEKNVEDTVIEDNNFKHLEVIMKDPRVVKSVSLYPKRNITFTSNEKDLVLCLFDVIMKVIIEDVAANDSEIVLLAATPKMIPNNPLFF